MASLEAKYKKGTLYTISILIDWDLDLGESFQITKLPIPQQAGIEITMVDTY